MFHRYGRHGPHAWLRRRKRRLERYLPALVPSVSIVRIQVPINTERIIIIVQRPEEFHEPDEENTPLIPFPDSRLIGPSQDERSSIYQELELKAKLDAEKRAQTDIHRYKYQGEPFPTKEYLRDDALLKASDAMTFTYLLKGKLDTDTLRQHYVQAFLQAYEKYLERASMIGVIVGEEERKIQQLARNDVLQHRQEGVNLSDVELSCHAAIRAYEYLDLDTRTSGYLTSIMKYSHPYKHAYKEEKDRPSRPTSFPGGGQSGRYVQS